MAILETRRDGSVDVDVFDELSAVRADWAALESSGACTPFQTMAWLEPWYAHVAPHFAAGPLFVRVRDHATGAPIMLLPLVKRRHAGLTVVEFADLGASDYRSPTSRAVA